MKITNVNFVEQKFVSVVEQKRSKSLKIISLFVAAVFLFFAIVLFGLNYYFQKQLENVQAQQKQLVSQIESPENKKKETLYFLVRDRIKKINEINKAKIIISEELSQLKKIAEIFAIKDVSIDGKTSKLEVSADKYDKISDFLKNLDKYNINRKSVFVGQTNFKENKYSISLNFSFL